MVLFVNVVNWIKRMKSFVNKSRARNSRRWFNEIHQFIFITNVDKLFCLSICISSTFSWHETTDFFHFSLQLDKFWILIFFYSFRIHYFAHVPWIAWKFKHFQNWKDGNSACSPVGTNGWILTMMKWDSEMSVRYEARRRGRSSPESLGFWACETPRR